MTSYRSFLACLFASAVLVGNPCAAETATTRISDPVYLQAQRLVEVEPGRRMNIYCTGSGSPTVVFDAGLTDASSVWGFVQPAISVRTRACSYDRAGVGFSDPATRPGSSGNIVQDLRNLLRQAGVPPPYILVGHSYGGMNVRLFAHLYPQEVEGLVLVDPTHEDWSEGFRKLDPRQSEEWRQAQVQHFQQLGECISTAKTGFVPGSPLAEKCSFPRDPHLSDAINDAYQLLFMRPGFQAAQLGEEESVSTTSADELRRARGPLGDLPLVVLTRAPFPLSPSESKELRDKKNQLWFNVHQDLATLSRRGVHRVVPGAGHYIQIDQPAAVTQAILDVLDMLQSKRFPSSCSLSERNTNPQNALYRLRAPRAAIELGDLERQVS